MPIRGTCRVTANSGRPSLYRSFLADSHALAIVIAILVLISGSLESPADAFSGQFLKRKISSIEVIGVQKEIQNPDEDPSDFQRFLEVSRPIISPNQRPVETVQLLYHEFADTYSLPPPTSQYVPNIHHKKWNKAVLKWSAVCRGRQFDRIAGVWLGGVEILRTCTAEPTLNGIIWEVEKDVTQYEALWKKPQEVLVAMGNVVDSTYTGIFNVTITVDFYHESSGHQVQQYEETSHHGSKSTSKLELYSSTPADVILPVNEPTYENGGDGYWFQLSSQADRKNASLQIPQNTYRAVLEVCLSPHGNDEFWYTNPPNEYLVANNISGVPGNGSFREVVVSIDEIVVGTLYPFVVVYTGGVNPLFWRPVVAIGAFNLPSYNFDITPLVGYLLDGKSHTFSLTVTDSLYIWLLQANLHIWVDPKRPRTTGRLTEYRVPASTPKLKANFCGFDGSFLTTASRSISYVGYVDSSFGNLTTSSSYTFKFSNKIVYSKNGLLSDITQVTSTDALVGVKTAEKEISLDREESIYPFRMTYLEILNTDKTITIDASIAHKIKLDLQSVKPAGSSFSFLENSQTSTGSLFISVNNTISGLGATRQSLSYEGTDGCYKRTISTTNYTIMSDVETTFCSNSS